ncbi:glutathione S-transferase family protein [Tahibacter harae]|uniref:Glutathione S-transferase n=1 Tax=Tahibacter harae TaxID=2963937 RepID=A0ABT1QNJ4_9GAMM|nr:glutathione S-transferase [Tahibacter harae]MCQ4164017.1 glutathione S-transferase [Tahibacter harae]
MYILYYSPGSASMLPHLLLREIGAQHELRAVSIDSGANRSPDYLKLNPNGVLPTLVIDGKPHAETAALLLMLCERHPEAGLAPAPGTPQRLDFLQGVMHLANTLQPAFRLWFYPGDLPQADADAVKAGVRSRIEDCFARLDAQLDGRDYLLGGDKPSALDFYAVMLMRWSRNMPRPATQWPRLQGLADRIRARDSWRKLYELEGLTEWA